jgi:hypothetical protein
MIYNSLSEIFEHLDKTRDKIYKQVENLNEEQESFRKDNNSWSIAEILEHLSATEKTVVGLFKKMLDEAESAGRWNNRSEKGIGPVSLETIINSIKDKRFDAPEFVRPNGGVPIKGSIDRMRTTREALHALHSRIEALDMSGITYPHPIFGPIDLYQWLAFIGLHEYRHLQQIKSLMELPNFKKH